MTGIGDRAHQHPLVLRRERQSLVDEIVGLARVGADDAGDEAEIDAGAFRIFERAETTERLYRRRHAREIGLLPVLVHELLHVGDRYELTGTSHAGLRTG